MTERLLELDHVSKRYELAEEAPPVVVLQDILLTVNRGESLAIIGPSGSGKSTLLNIIGTLDYPSSGKVLLEGRDLSRMNDEQIAALRNRRIGFVFQAQHLLPQCTVLENVLVPTLATSDQALRNGAGMRAQRLLERVGLGARFNHRPGQLSVGERQRVAVVRALINGPALLLADEPTGSLDHASALSLADLLVQLNKEEAVTLIVVTHALDLAQRLGQMLELRDGALERKRQ